MRFDGSLKEYFDSNYIPEPNSGCWLWVGSMTRRYGVVRIRGRRGWRASRVSYELHHGPIPDGLYVLHKCDTPCCVNPDHLFVGTHAENMADMVIKGRSPRRLGERNHAAKLTAEVVRELRDARSRGLSWSALARESGVTRRAVRLAVCGETWAHVAGERK